MHAVLDVDIWGKTLRQCSLNSFAFTTGFFSIHDKRKYKVRLCPTLRLHVYLSSFHVMHSTDTVTLTKTGGHFTHLPSTLQEKFTEMEFYIVLQCSPMY